jgi:23S rRNA pseudouridine2605 synthase
MLMHPRHEAEKVYRAEVEGMLGADDINRLEKGIDIGGYVTAPASVRVIDKTKKRSVVEISIHEGKNRQVRRMFESIGHPVLKLKRTAIGGITVGTLEEGKWRYLTKTEVEDLKLKYSSNLSAE